MTQPTRTWGVSIAVRAQTTPDDSPTLSYHPLVSPNARDGPGTRVQVRPSQCMMPLVDHAQTSSGRSPRIPAIDPAIGIGFHATQPSARGAGCAGQAASARRHGIQTPWVVRWISAAPAIATASSKIEPVLARRPIPVLLSAHRPVMSRDLAALVVIAIATATAAASACAHDAAKHPDPYVDNGVASIRTWIAGLPRCPPSQASLELASFRENEATAAVSVRGQLRLAANPTCTTVSCPGDRACCNSCFLGWIVAPDATDGPRELAIQKSGTDRPLSAVMRDCKVGAVREQLPATRVVVSGFLEGGVIIRASMCVVDDPAPAKVGVH
jgi:hypothetical protein